MASALSALGLTKDVRGEFRILSALATPVIFTYLLSFAIALGSQIMVGRLGPSALAAAALANMFANATGNSIAVGSAAAVETLCSQAFGARNYERVGIVTQRGCAVMLMFCVPITAAWLCAGAVLEALGQPPDVVELAVPYIRVLILGMPASLIFEVLKRHLQCMGIMAPSVVAASISICVNMVCGSFFIFGTSLGFLGAPLAISLSQWSLVICIGIYFKYHRSLNARADRWRRWFTQLSKTASAAGVVVPADDAGADMRSSVAGMETDTRTLGPAVAAPELVGTKHESRKIDSSGVEPSGHLTLRRPGEEEGAYATVATTPSVGTADAAVAPSGASTPSAVTPAAAEPELSTDDLLDASLAAGLSFKHALSGWREYLGLGIPSAALLFTEWGSFECGAFIAGLCGTETIASHSIMATTAGLSFMPALGLSIGASIRIGQHMGDRSPEKAKLSYRTVMLCASLYVLINAMAVIAVSPAWGWVFSDSEVVATDVEHWLWMLSIYTWLDGWQCITCGVLRGIGRPTIGTAANVLSWLIIGLPLAYVLAVPAGRGLPGIWAAFILAVFSCYVAMSIGICMVDWDKESAKAHARATQGQTVKGGSAAAAPDASFESHIVESSATGGISGAAAMSADVAAAARHYHNSSLGRVEDVPL